MQTPETVRAFSATAYFFAKELHRRTGEPVGIINASLGGSLISGWMSREMLEGFDSLLETADRYADEEFYSGRIRKNEEEAGAWISDLDRSSSSSTLSAYLSASSEGLRLQ